MYKLLTNGYNSSIIIIKKGSENMEHKDIIKVIDQLINKTIQKYGMEHKKTIQVITNAENLKEKYNQNLVKLF